MKLNLEKDLIVLDLETTGLSVCKDRICQMAIIKIFADGRPNLKRVRLINPTIPIPKEASDVHGITNEKIANEPTFIKIAKGLMDLIGDSDILTYNGNRFDIPLLMEEFERAGIQLDLTNRKTIDAQRIFHKMEPRTLSAALRFYCDKKIEGAHDAMNDTEATLDVFLSQINKYDGVDIEDGKGNTIEQPIKNDMQAVHDFTNDPNEVDFAGKVIYNSQGVAVFNFGKLQGKPVGESLSADEKYYNWIMGGDFTQQTKRIISSLVNQYKDSLIHG